MQVAARANRVDICQLLLSVGRRPDQWNVSSYLISQGLCDDECGNDIYAQLVADLVRSDDLVMDRTFFNGSSLLASRVSWGSEFFAEAVSTRQRAEILMHHASEPVHAWPLSVRLEFSETLRKSETDPRAFLELFQLPQNEAEMQVLEMKDQKSVLRSLLGDQPTVPESWCLEWLRAGQELAGDSLQAYAMREWLYRSESLHWPRQRLKMWLQAVLLRGADLHQYGRNIAADWCHESRKLLCILRPRDDLLWCGNFEVGCGPLLEDWSLQLSTRRDVALWGLQRAPAAWPEHASLPRTTWGHITEDDRERGHWKVERAYSIYGKHCIRLDDDLDLYAELCVGTQDDCSPAIFRAIDSGLPRHATKSSWARSRSQPALYEQFIQAEEVYELYRHGARERLHRNPVWLASEIEMLSERLSKFELVRRLWQEQVDYLCGSGLKALLSHPRKRNMTSEGSPFVNGLSYSDELKLAALYPPCTRKLLQTDTPFK